MSMQGKLGSSGGTGIKAYMSGRDWMRLSVMMIVTVYTMQATTVLLLL